MLLSPPSHSLIYCCLNRLLSTMDNNHSTLHFYQHHLRNLCRTSIIQRFNSFNGDAFYPLSVWPQEFKLIFWKKPISDKDTFKLFFGNGGSPHLISHWILTSQHWTTDKKAEKCASTRLPTQQHGQQVTYLVLL